MGSSITTDPRLDPRIKALMGAMPDMEARDAENREQFKDHLRWRSYQPSRIT